MLDKGGSRMFFRRGCTRLLLYFNTNKPHSFFFCRIPVVLENHRSSRGGGVCTPCTLPLDLPQLEWFSIQILVNSEIFKLLLNLFLTHLRAQIACYELKEDLSPVMLMEIFHDSLKISKFSGICMENLAVGFRYER